MSTVSLVSATLPKADESVASCIEEKTAISFTPSTLPIHGKDRNPAPVSTFVVDIKTLPSHASDAVDLKEFPQ